MDNELEEATTTTGISSEIEEILDLVDQRFKCLKHFDVVYDSPYNHHFIFHNAAQFERQFLWSSRNSKSDQDAKLKKRLEQEWEILEANLPNSMYVKAYETRKDLMRAAIIGLEGTPYSYCVFFFDIFIPKDYPSKPPQVFRHPDRGLPQVTSNSSYAPKISTGCMGFFNGDDSTFKWDPQSSSILGLLGFFQRDALRIGKIYAKDVDKDFLLSNMAMLGVLRDPPTGFHDFVKGYFRKYSHKILMKVKGSLDNPNLPNSTLLLKLFWELYEAFEDNGSYCKHLAHGMERHVSSPPHRKSSSRMTFEDYLKNGSSSKISGLTRWL